MLIIILISICLYDIIYSRKYIREEWSMKKEIFEKRLDKYQIELINMKKS